MSNIEQIFADFDKIDPGQTGGNSNWLPTDGTFIVSVTEVKCKTSEKGTGDVSYIVEFTVDESSNENVKAGDGKVWCWVVGLPGKFNMGLRDVKRFVVSAAGMDPTSAEARAIGADVVTESYGPEQELVGCKVKATTHSKEGSTYVNTTWDPVN